MTDTHLWLRYRACHLLPDEFILEDRALQILKSLHADYSSAQVMMILAFAQQLQTVSDAHNTSLDTIINGDHLNDIG